MKNFNDLKTYAAQSQSVSFNSMLASERFTSNFTQGFTLSANFTMLVASAAPTSEKFPSS